MTRKSQLLSGIFIAVAGAICFSTKAILVKLAYRDTNVDAITLLALRMVFSLPFFLAFAIIFSSKRGNVRFTPRQWLAVALVGCLGYYVSSLLDFLGLQYVSAAIERLILFVYPTIVLLISSVIFNVVIKPYQWLAVLMTYAGLVAAFWGEYRIGDDTANLYKGGLLIFGSAITYATYLVASGRIIPKVGAPKFNSYAMSFASVAVIMHFLINSESSLLGLSTTAYLYGAAMAIVSTVIPSFLVVEAIKRIGSDNAAAVGSIGPVSTILQAYFLLGEAVHAMQIAGTVLILAGIVIISRKARVGALEPSELR